MNILAAPMSAAELAHYPRINGVLTAVIRMDLNDLIDRDLDTVLDSMNSLVTEVILGNISYSVVGFEPDNVLLVEVTAAPMFDDVDA